MRQTTLLILIVVLFGMENIKKAHAEITGPIVPMEFFEGVDAALYNSHIQVFSGQILRIDHNDHRSAIEEGLAHFLDHKAPIPVTNGKEVPRADENRRHVLGLNFIISTRELHDDDGTVLVSVSSILTRYAPSKTNPNGAVSYPFIASTDKEELLEQISEAVRTLTTHLPGYIRCANREKGSNICQEITEPFNNGRL